MKSERTEAGSRRTRATRGNAVAWTRATVRALGGYYQPCEVCREWLRKDVTSPVTWNGTFSSKDGVGAQWKWGAAVYTQFTDSQHSKKYNQLMVKAGHQTSCQVNNGDHAGTPEGHDKDGTAWKAFVIGGGTGGGGSNYRGV